MAERESSSPTPGAEGEEGRRCAYLAWYRLGREGQGNRGAAASEWLSENLVACQECGLQLSSFLLEGKKKKDADDSGTSHQGPLRAKKGVRGRNHSCDSQHRGRALPVNIWAPALLGQVRYWRTDLSAERQSLAPRCKLALRMPK